MTSFPSDSGPLRIALIQGSIRAGRFNDVITAWTRRALEAAGFEILVIDPADPRWLPIQTGDSSAADALGELLRPVDGFVVTTPEYNHSAPGAVKSLMDATGDSWALKPVAFISYGGRSGGLRAVEALRLVVAELHAVALRDTASFAFPHDRFDADNQLLDAAEDATMARLISTVCWRLDWWARALRSARLARPYEKPAVAGAAA